MGRLVRGTSDGRLVTGEVLSAKEQGAQILATAIAEAERRLATVATLEEEARRRGYAEGHAAGRDAAEAEVTALLVAARAEAEATLRGQRNAAVALARRMAEKIVGRAIELHPSLLVDIAAHALAASRARSGPITLRLHPEDLGVVERDRAGLTAHLAASVDLMLVADESVGRHGCIVETPIGRLDARLDAQLDALERALQRR